MSIAWLSELTNRYKSLLRCIEQIGVIDDGMAVEIDLSDMVSVIGSLFEIERITNPERHPFEHPGRFRYAGDIPALPVSENLLLLSAIKNVFNFRDRQIERWELHPFCTAKAFGIFDHVPSPETKLNPDVARIVLPGWTPKDIPAAEWNRAVKSLRTLEYYLRVFAQPAQPQGTDTKKVKKKPGPKAKRYNPEQDAKLVSDWEVSGLTRKEFDHMRGLEPGETFAACERHRKRKRIK